MPEGVHCVAGEAGSLTDALEGLVEAVLPPGLAADGQGQMTVLGADLDRAEQPGQGRDDGHLAPAGLGRVGFAEGAALADAQEAAHWLASLSVEMLVAPEQRPHLVGAKACVGHKGEAKLVGFLGEAQDAIDFGIRGDLQDALLDALSLGIAAGFSLR